MKLITETRDLRSSGFDVETIVESATGKKRYYITGPMAEGNTKNRNGRIYETKMLAEKVADYDRAFIRESRAYGEFGHPAGPTVNGDRICIRVVEMQQKGDQFIGKAQVSSTPMGTIVAGILEDGGRLGVSTRGMGSLQERNGVNYVQPDYYLAAIDVVTDPSGPNCYVNGVMENVNWVYDDSHGWRTAELVHEQKKTLHKTKMSNLSEAQKLRLFENFINSIR